MNTFINSLKVPTRLVGGGIAVLFALAMAACGDDRGSNAAPAGLSAAPAAAAPSASSGTVQIIDKVKFQSAELKVAKGATLEFANKDNQAHTATADDKSFDTGLLAAGASATVTFDKAGTFAYHCSLHPFMTARVVVA